LALILYTYNIINCSIFPIFRQLTFVCILYQLGKKRPPGQECKFQPAVSRGLKAALLLKGSAGFDLPFRTGRPGGMSFIQMNSTGWMPDKQK
jgi:hypothetical protein